MSTAITGEMRFLMAERLIPFTERKEKGEKFCGGYLEYKKAADKGHAAAQYKYGYILSRGLYGEVNVKKGMRYIRRSAMQGYPPAVTETARGYYYGFGFTRNLKRAVKEWEKGAKMGIGEAAYYLGLAYYKGEGVKKDEKKAEKFFILAKNDGFKEF